MLAVYRDLAAWASSHRAAGTRKLDDVRLSDGATSTIDGTNTLVLLYQRAVFTAAKAEVVERYRDVDLTSAGQRKVEDMEPSVTELRRDSIHAIRDILGVIIREVSRVKPLREHFKFVQHLAAAGSIGVMGAARALQSLRQDLTIATAPTAPWTAYLQTEDGEPFEDDTGTLFEDAA